MSQTPSDTMINKDAMKRTLLLLPMLLLLGCKAINPETEFKGNIFIVTQGAQNIKLGLVEVTAIPETEINAHLEKNNLYLNSEREKLNQAFQDATQKYEDAKSRYDIAESRYNASYARAKAELERMKAAVIETEAAFTQVKERVQAATNEASMDKGNLDSLSSVMNLKKTELELAKLKLEAFPSGNLFFTALPAGCSKAISDADGNFTIKLPKKGRYALAAKSSRQVVDKKEEYYWLIWINADGSQQSPLILSNNNFVTSDAQENIKKANIMSYQ